MADPPPSKKVFSIFHPRPKPPVADPPSKGPDTSPNPPTTAADASTSTATSSTDRVPTRDQEQGRAAPSKKEEEANYVVLSSSDDEDAASSSTLDASSNNRSKVKASTRKAVGRKGKAKAITVDSDDSNVDQEEEDIVIVKGSTPKKKKKNKAKQPKRGGEREGGKKPIKLKPRSHLESIDLTDSPPRKPPSSSSFSFAPLSDVYRQERERRRIIAEGLEPRWPTSEEHGSFTSTSSSSSSSRHHQLSTTSPPPPASVQLERWPGKHQEVDKGKGKESSTPDEYFSHLSNRLVDNVVTVESTHRPPHAHALEYRDVPFASTSTLIPTYPPHPLLDRLASTLLLESNHSPSSSSSSSSSSSNNNNNVDVGQSELWTTKYGPKKANEVLGDVSGTSAKLLKEWLIELKVADSSRGGGGGGGRGEEEEEEFGDSRKRKRRRFVNRGIDKSEKNRKKRKKKRRMDGLDDFLAESSDDEEEEVDGQGIDFLGGSRMFEDLEDQVGDGEEVVDDDDDDLGFGLFPSTASSSSTTFHRLTNLILLVGPNGSGKTVSVQAVAQELGYEIFEVNPGSGKRRAKDLEAEVGDVGRNHIVRASPRKGRPPGASGKDFFAGFKVKAKVDKEHDQSSKIKPRGGGPTQSLILIEEVDVLFPGEEDFWTGVRALAEESRRPIILTCNDVNLVPIDQLGLQKIHLDRNEPLLHLSFAPPCPSLVTRYLQLVALSEHHILSSSSQVERLYQERTISREGKNEAWLFQNARGVRTLPHPFRNADQEVEMDLRKAVMQLQFELQNRRRGVDEDGGQQQRWIVGGLMSDEEEEGEKVASDENNEGEDEGWLDKAVVAADALSFADSHVSRKIDTRLEDLDHGSFTTRTDAELGGHYRTLPPFLRSTPPRTQLAFLGIEPSISSTIGALAYSLYPRAVKFSDRRDEIIESKKLSYLNSLALLSTQFFYDPIHETYSPLAPILPNPSLVIDYLPLYRHLTLIDDEREKRTNGALVDGIIIGGGGEIGIGRGVRRSTRVVGGQGKVKVKKEIEWREKGDAEFVRNSGFKGII